MAESGVHSKGEGLFSDKQLAGWDGKSVKISDSRDV